MCPIKLQSSTRGSSLPTTSLACPFIFVFFLVNSVHSSQYILLLCLLIYPPAHDQSKAENTATLS